EHSRNPSRHIAVQRSRRQGSQATPPTRGATVRARPLPGRGRPPARHLPQNVSRWSAKWRQGGRVALAGPTRLGRPPRLSDSDWRRVERALLAGAQANGFDTDLWTLPRVAEVIWRTCGVSYHPGYVWWLLRRSPWRPERPDRRAAERDEAEIARWRAEEWPRIKGGR